MIFGLMNRLTHPAGLLRSPPHGEFMMLSDRLANLRWQVQELRQLTKCCTKFLNSSYVAFYVVFYVVIYGDNYVANAPGKIFVPVRVRSGVLAATA